MTSTRAPQRNVLDYLPDTKVAQATIRRAYMQWREIEKMPERCDNERCLFHESSHLTWNEKPLRMILDHIDGNRKNNRPSNLRLLCPNCNSQLPTHGGANKGRIRKPTSDSYHVVERDGRHEVKVMLTGVSATASVGSLSAKKSET